MTKKTYNGSCHCGKVRFEAEIDLSQGTGKCNCSICWKQRSWAVLLQPDAFRLLTGDGDLTSYSFGTHQGKHQFCRHCGVRSFSRGHVEELGGAFVSVQIASLDDLDPADLLAAPVRIGNGRDNDWMNPPTESRHL